MRSGSAAIARNGKMDVMPMTWNSACASDSEKMATSFALPYGRARKRTRRIRSETLWINRDKAVPSYTFKNTCISQRREGELSAGTTSLSKIAAAVSERRAEDCGAPLPDTRAFGLCGRARHAAFSFFDERLAPRPSESVSTFRTRFNILET